MSRIAQGGARGSEGIEDAPDRGFLP